MRERTSTGLSNDLYGLALMSIGEEEEEIPVMAASTSSSSTIDDKGIKLMLEAETTQNILRAYQERLRDLYCMQCLYIEQLTNAKLFAFYLYISSRMGFVKQQGLPADPSETFSIAMNAPTLTGEPIGYLLCKGFIEGKLYLIERDIEINSCSIRYYENRLEELEAQKAEYLRERIAQERIAEAFTPLPVAEAPVIIGAQPTCALCIKSSGHGIPRTTLSALGKSGEPTLTLHDFMLDVIKKSPPEGPDKSSRRRTAYEYIFNRLYPDSARRIGGIAGAGCKDAPSIS